MATALSDVTVLDLTSDIAGPYCTKVLAGMGAEVIKIERPWGGDPTRHLGPFKDDIPDPETSALFLDLNMGKKSLTLDLRSGAGRSVALDLAASADMVVESFRPGTVEGLGLGYEAVRSLNPRVAYTSLSNFGQTGPYRDYLGSEIVFYGSGGNMSGTGLPDRPPVRLANYVTLYQAGNMAAASTMVAFHGARGGEGGQHSDVAIYETAAASVNHRLQWIASYAYSGMLPTRADNIWQIFPNGVFPCKDGFIDIHGGGPRFFPRTCRMIGRPELAQDVRFATPKDLVAPERRREFNDLFRTWAEDWTMAQIQEKAQLESVYCAPIYSPGHVFEDPHFEEREFFQEVDHPVVGTALYPGVPTRMTATPWKLERAPLLGEHNRDVLQGRLGFSAVELAQLRRANVV